MNKKLLIGLIVSASALVLIIGYGVEKQHIKNTQETVNVADEVGRDAVVTSNPATAVSNNSKVDTETSTSVINTDVAKVIESDEETGAQTIVNTDGDVVVTGDTALQQAEKNNAEQEEVDKMVDDVLADIIPDDADVEESDKVDELAAAKSNEDIKQVYKADNSDTNSDKSSEAEVDAATKKLFDEMGWDTDTGKHQHQVDCTDGYVANHYEYHTEWTTP